LAVTVGSADDLLVDRQVVGPVSWSAGPAHGELLVQCSAHGRPDAAVIEPGPGGTIAVEWRVRHRRVAPGQAVVLYDGDEVVGGGPAWDPGAALSPG